MKIVTYLKKLKYFTFKQKVLFVLNTISGLIQNHIPNSFKNTFRLTTFLSDKAISIIATENAISFTYPINNHLINIELKKNSSDSMVFEQIIILEEYLFLCELIIKKQININTVIDAGANIGLTTIYLKQYFEDAQFILLEPEAETFARLKKNLALNKITNAICLNEGLWHEKTELFFDRNFRDKEAWSVRLTSHQNNEPSIKTVTINDLMAYENYNKIDLLKIDIEGSEKELFLTDLLKLNWLKSVKIIAIEIHDETHSRTEIETILKNYNFELFYSGELTIGINTNFNE
jgi:FkbM family methyltransferase